MRSSPIVDCRLSGLRRRGLSGSSRLTNAALSPALRLLALLVCLGLSAEAYAAGLFLAPRGVRPLGRAGAFVAGADDVHALTYNPAGLAFADKQVLVDLMM